MCGNVYGKQNQEKLIISPEKAAGKINTYMYVSSGLITKTNEHAEKNKKGITV